MYKISSNKEEYIYDPQHDKNPGGGYEKTQKGWTLNTKQRSIDLTNKNEKDLNINGVHIHQKQLQDNDVVTFMDANGNIKKSAIKDLSKEQRQQIVQQIKISGLVHAQGFGDYTQVNLSSFNKNKQNILRFLQDKNIPQRKNQRQTPVSKRLQGFLEQQQQNLNMIVQKYGQGLTNPNSRKAINNYIQTLSEVIKQACSEGGGMQDVTQEALDAYLQQDFKRLIYQQVQSRGRSLGDHGVRHLIGNAINSKKILDELQNGGIGSKNIDGTLNGKKITGKDKLMAMSTMINHDIGYTLGQVALDAGKGGFHKSYSGLIAHEQSSRYQKIFGKDGKELMVGNVQTYENGKPVLYNEQGRLQQSQVYNDSGQRILSQKQYQNCKIKHLKGKQGMIQYHDSSNYDWKNDPVRSAVSLSDCTSLFGVDKVQELFFNNDEAMKQITKMQMIENCGDISDQMKTKAFEGFKKKMYTLIQNLQNATILDKDLLLSQVKEMPRGKFGTVDVLSRSSGSLTGYEYDSKNNTMIVNTEYSESGNLLQNMFGDQISKLQWTKLYKDIKDSGQIYIDQKGNQNLFLGDKENKQQSKIKVNINGFVGNTFGSKGVSQAYLSVKSYPIKKQLARLSESLNQLKNKGINISRTQSFKKIVNLSNRLQEKTEKQKTKGQKIFGSNYEQVKKLLQKARDGVDISEQLKSLGLSEQQKSYLLGGFIKTSSKHKIAMQIAREQYINKLAMRLAMEQIKKYTQKIGNIMLYYYNTGQLNFLIEGHMYKFTKYYRMDFVNKFIDKNYQRIKDIRNCKELQIFLKENDISYRRLF